MRRLSPVHIATIAGIVAMLWINTAFCQTHTIDSLKKKLAVSHFPRQRADVLLSLCQQSDSFSADTLLAIATSAKKLAHQLADKKLESTFNFYIATAYNTSGKIDRAEQICNGELPHLSKAGSSAAMFDQFWWLKCMCLVKKRLFQDAQSQAFALLNNSNAQHDTLNSFRADIAIGWVFDNLGQYDKSLDWFFKALHTSNDSAFYKKHCQIYFNIAAIYGTMLKMDAAKAWLKKGLAYAISSDNLSQQVNCLSFQAGLYDNDHNFKAAEADFKRALQLQEQIGDPFYTVAILVNFAEFYDEWQQPRKAIPLCNEGIALVRRNGMKTRLLGLYETLTEAYKALKNYKTASRYQDSTINLKDSIYQKTSAEAIAALQVKYDVQQKEKTIISQKLTILKRDVLISSIALFAVLISIVLFVLFRSYRVKQRQKLQAMLEREHRAADEAVRVAEEKERKRIGKNLHDNLGVYAAAIAANTEQIVRRPDVENAVAIGELNRNSQYMISQLSDSIWALNTESLTLTQISDRLKVFIHRIQASYPNVLFEFTEEIENDADLLSSKAFDLFQVVQEAITNALKYSGCSSIDIFIKCGVGWEVTIEDNGIGMGNETKTHGGNGLKNMRLRSAEAGWSIKWLSNKPSGTIVVIQNT